MHFQPHGHPIAHQTGRVNIGLSSQERCHDRRGNCKIVEQNGGHGKIIGQVVCDSAKPIVIAALPGGQYNLNRA
jgi:hypothetical protein